MDDTLYDFRRSDGRMFHCPNGHPQHYTETTASALEKMTTERDNWRAEAQRLLEVVDRQRNDAIAARSPHFVSVFGRP